MFDSQSPATRSWKNIVWRLSSSTVSLQAAVRHKITAVHGDLVSPGMVVLCLYTNSYK